MVNNQQENDVYVGKPFHFYCKLVFTKYRLTSQRLILEEGFLSTKTDEIRLHRIHDLTTTVSLWQRIFGLGSITIFSSDVAQPVYILRDIKKPHILADQLSQLIERERNARRYIETAQYDGNFGNPQ